MLFREQLTAAGRTVDSLADSTGIPLERLNALQRGATPNVSEVGALADALSIDPVHLFRSAPSVLAQRSGTRTGLPLDDFLNEVDSYLAAYAHDVRPEINYAAPAGSLRGARRTGEGWARRHGTRTFQSGAEDALLEVIERELSIPVFIWPIREALLGATVDFDGVIGIWVNSWDQPGSAQRFTLAHELGHVLLRHVNDRRQLIVDRTGDIDRPGSFEEKAAGACGAGLLADAETLNSFWPGEVAPSSVAAVAAGIGASFAATLILLLHHGLITRADRETLSRGYVRTAFRDAGCADVYDEFERQRGRKRLSSYLPETDSLERALDRLA